jgi:hypothetical protein
MTKPKKRTPKGSTKSSSNKLARLKRDESDDEDSNEESEDEEQEVEEEHANSEEESSQGKQSSPGGRFKCGGPVLNAVANPYKLTLKDILQPAGNIVETTTVLLNDLCGALIQGHPIDHTPSSKKDLEVGYMLMKQFINHKEVLLAKTQHQLHHMQGVLAFVQGTEDENNISLNKYDFVTHITKNVIDKVALKDLVIRIPFPVKRLADGVKNINDCFVPGVHYTCTPVSVYGRHIKSLIVANLDVQPHEARKYSITMEQPGWYKDLVENHELLKKIHVMQCERRETITYEVRHMVSLIVDSMDAGMDEESRLFSLFKAAALLGTEREEETDFKYLQYPLAVGWKHLHERLPSDRNKERKRLASRMKHLKTFGLPWETRLHLHGKSVFEVCLSLILSIFLTNIKRGVMKMLKTIDPPERCDGKTPEAYQVSTRHYDALLEQVNGDCEATCITKNELTALQNAGYCNVVTDYIRNRATKLTSYKNSITEEDINPYTFMFPEVDELVDDGGLTTYTVPELPLLEVPDTDVCCEEAEMEEV